MSSDSKILHYSRLVPMDYMLGPDSDAIASYACIDVRTELAKLLMENMKTSKEYIVKFDRLTGEDRLNGMYRIDGYLLMKPVWHGHWETLPNGNIQCSECGTEPHWNCSDWKPNYCPNCGAKMDEVSE